MKIKILTITTAGLNDNDGISTILYDYYSRFSKSDFELHLVVDGRYKNEIVQKFKDINVEIVYLPSRKQETKKYMFSLWKLMLKEKYDVIYVHGSSAIMVIELLIAASVRCKVRVVHSHNTSCTHTKVDKKLRPLFYKLYTNALACGNAAGHWLYEKRNFLLMPNGRELKKYAFDLNKRNEMRTVLKLDEKCLAIGHVGNFNPQKNHMFLIDIFSELVKIRANSKLYLMGGGKKIEACQKYAAEKHILNQIVFTGAIDNVPEMIQAMDIMILPSLYEGLPLVVLEWQMCALPIIMSDVITEECVFTELVERMSLHDDACAWAQKIDSMVLKNREDIKDKVLQEAKINGFDIDTNAMELQEYLKKELIKKQG